MYIVLKLSRRAIATHAGSHGWSRLMNAQSTLEVLGFAQTLSKFHEVASKQDD